MEKLNPNLPEDMQDMELKPVTFGPPAFGSPDPQTGRHSLNDALDNGEAAEDAEEGKKKTKKKDD